MRTRTLTVCIALVALFVASLASAQEAVKTFNSSGQFTGYAIVSTAQAQPIVVNGQELRGAVRFELPGATVDPATNTVVVPLASASSSSAKGAGTQGNTTISGTLTVTGNTYLGASNEVVQCYANLVHSYAAPAASPSIAISADHTELADAGGDVTLTLPTPVSGREIFIYNNSATYSASDGGAVTIGPNSGTTLHAGGGTWK